MTDVPMPQVLGYCDDWSVAAGGTIRFRIASLTSARPYRAQLVRVISSDTGPAGAGLKTEDVAAPLNGIHEAALRPIPVGSFVLVDRPDAVEGLGSFTVQALVQPMLRERAQQAIVSTLVEGGRRPGFALIVDQDGALAIHFADGTRISTGAPMELGRWHHVAASVDATRGEVFVRQTPLPARGFDRPPAVEAAGVAAVGRLAPGALRIGAIGRAGPTPGHFATWLFNGKIEAPSLADRALAPEDLRAAAAAGTTMPPSDCLRAAWDFTQDIAGVTVRDIGPRKLHGRTVNAPKRAVVGSRWDGSEHDWRRAPAHYAAIHFHEDDLYDACWPDTLTWSIPADQRSAIYALRLDTDGAPPFWITFFVRPPRGKATARLAFLASTATYSVYANYRARMVPSTVDLAFGALQQIDGTDMLVMAHPELGASTYDKHPDGSGVCHVSLLRPLVNVRPTGRLWNLQLDLCLIDWLEAQGIAYDVVTDDDLHREGLSLLENYAVVMSGCHPEYWSAAMWDGLDAWLNRGGRFMYMGGNGFYWKVTYVETHPGMIELRRAEGGTRAWAEVPGEYLHASTGDLGGLWRRNGRTPNSLVGVGFIAQGFDYASWYERTPASRDDRVAWMFEGVGEARLGDYGCALGGAAGMEIDCASTALGTPAHALVVASSVEHSKVMNLVVEEINAGFSGAYGGTWPAVRADIAFFETPGGGAMWSTGSISFVGSLAHRGYDNGISRMTANVVRRFLDPRPFEIPARA
ncbi:MAG: N,N-dimethylformamidase [Alphaproteobacteria bacterium]|nr:N,N-dimethylformamidase [Alphaproteobacteria bacterium]